MSTVHDNGHADAPGDRPGDAAPPAFVAGLERLRRRGTPVATERWLLYAGGIMAPLGAVLVLIGWYGAAHTTRLFEEVPYLISGGIFGLVLVILGVGLYFGFWLTRLVVSQQESLEVLRRIEHNLTAPPQAARDGAAVHELVATRTGTMLHRPDCPVVAGRARTELRKIRSDAPGMTACKLCAPLEVS